MHIHEYQKKKRKNDIHVLENMKMYSLAQLRILDVLGLISSNTFICQLLCSYANHNPMTHSEGGGAGVSGAEGVGASICTLPNEIDVSTIYQCGNCRRRSPACRDTAHNSQAHRLAPRGRTSEDLVRISLFLSRLTRFLSFSFCLIALILLSHTHTHTHTLSNIIPSLSPVKLSHLHIPLGTDKGTKFAMKSLPGESQAHVYSSLVVCCRPGSKPRRSVTSRCSQLQTHSF